MESAWLHKLPCMGMISCYNVGKNIALILIFLCCSYIEEVIMLKI